MTNCTRHLDKGPLLNWVNSSSKNYEPRTKNYLSKQTHLISMALCAALWQEMQNKAKYPHFQSNIEDCKKNKPIYPVNPVNPVKKMKLQNKPNSILVFLGSCVPGFLYRFTKQTQIFPSVPSVAK
jgi:hypothetical protein